MAWDFSTEPEFQAQLDWMRDFVRAEIWPIETVFEELGQDGFMRAIAPLQEQVRERGLWAAHLPPELGGQGFGQVKLGLMHEILGSSPFAPVAFGNQAPDSGNSEVLALAGTEDQKEQWLHPLLAGDLRSAFSMTEPDTAGSDPTLLADARGRGRRLVGHQRPQVVLHQRLGGRLPDRHGGHRPGGAQVPARLDVHRAGRHAGRADPARRADDGAPVRALRRLRRARRDPLRGRARAEGRAARRARRRLPDRPAAAGAGPHPPLHALARRVSPGVRHAVRARAERATRTARCWPTSRRCRTGSPTRRPRCTRRG